MSEQRESYKGKEIIIKSSEKRETGQPGHHGNGGEHKSTIQLTIDGKDVHVMKLKDGKYASHLLPYVTFDSVLQFAKAVIDSVPDYNKWAA